MSDEKTEFPIAASLGNLGAHTFEAFDEVVKWMEAERTFWRWVAELSPNRPHVSEINNVLTSGWRRIDQALSEVKQRQGRADVHNYIRQLTQALTDCYSTGKCIHSSSTEAGFIQEVRKKDPEVAVHALGFLLGFVCSSRSAVSEEGVFRGLLFKYGYKDLAESQKSALENLQSRWLSHFDEVKNEYASLRKALEELLAESKDRNDKQIERHDGQHAELLKDSKGAHEKQFKGFQSEMDLIKKTYNEQLALQASVTYWKVKADSHRKLAIGFAFAVLVSFVSVGWTLNKTIGDVIGSVKIADATLSQLGLLLMMATVGVWVIRIMVRLLLSNVHLYTDATERRTMLLTYLALIRKGQGPKDDERQLILQALFRPTSTGIIRDDAAPPFMAEWLKRTTDTD